MLEVSISQVNRKIVYHDKKSIGFAIIGDFTDVERQL